MVKKELVLDSCMKNYINSAEIEELASKVREREKATSVEIVTMVVKKSAATRHVFWLLVLIALSVFIELNVYLFPELTYPQQLAFFALEVFVSFGIGTLSRFFYFQRLFTSDRDLQKQVASRAQVEFYNNKLNETAGRTGILIFVSLMERRVMVLADKSITDKLPKETWTEVVDNLIADLRTKRLSKGLEKAVEHISKLVSPLFPAQDSNPNELSDYIIIEGASSEEPDPA
jgi:putative membrane protein